MKRFLFLFAYFLIWTTPFLIAFLLWILWDILSTDYTILSFSTSNFLENNLPWLKTWVYSWFWNAWLDFWWAFPAFVMGSIKTIINTWIGIWLLKVAKRIP